MVQTSTNDGTYTVEPYQSNGVNYWVVLIRAENGEQGDLTYDPVGRTLLSTAMIPGAPGESDIRVMKEYSR